MGYSLVNILDPQTQVDTTVMATFYQSIVMLLFLQMDVQLWLLRDQEPSISAAGHGSAEQSLHVVDREDGRRGFRVGRAQIAAPVLAATLAADVILGLLACLRAADAADAAGACGEESFWASRY